MIEVSSKCSKVLAPINSPMFSAWTLALHDEFNVERFADEIDAIEGFEPFVKTIYSAFNQPEPKILTGRPINVKQPSAWNERSVVLGLSGGLDSVSQLLTLRNKGVDVVPFTMKNANYSSSAREFSACQTICSKLGIELVSATFDKGKKDNPFHKHWMENPIKNQMILSFMVDYAIEHGIPDVSLGENGTTHVGVDAVPGINLTDAVEVNQTWMDGVQRWCPAINFVPMDATLNKLEQLKLVMEHGLQDDFYSCLASQRANGMLRELNQRKYCVKLWRYNCGCSCRKCAQINLLLHYNGYSNYPNEFVEACWSKLKKDKQVGPLFFDERTREQALLGTY